MSATPRTDAESDRLKSGLFDGMYVPVNFARELETELAEANAARDRAEAKVADHEPLISKGAEAMGFIRFAAIVLGLNGPQWSEEPGFSTKMTSALLEFSSEQDRLREALELMERAYATDHPVTASELYRKAKALSAPTTGRASAWRSIESAPRDEAILGWLPTWTSAREVFWYDDHWECAFAGTMPVYPTHWQPLPQPPSADLEGGK